MIASTTSAIAVPAASSHATGGIGRRSNLSIFVYRRLPVGHTPSCASPRGSAESGFPVDKNGVVTRRPVPTIAWVLSGGTAIALLVGTLVLAARGGTVRFYAEGDAFHYRLIARDLFGAGHG